jgi:hypothetical protein
MSTPSDTMIQAHRDGDCWCNLGHGCADRQDCARYLRADLLDELVALAEEAERVLRAVFVDRKYQDEIADRIKAAIAAVRR